MAPWLAGGGERARSGPGATGEERARVQTPTLWGLPVQPRAPRRLACVGVEAAALAVLLTPHNQASARGQPRALATHDGPHLWWVAGRQARR